MQSSLIATFRWSLAAPVSRAWPLLASAEDWPTWWTSVASTQLEFSTDASTPPAVPMLPLAWSALLGRKLRLRVTPFAQQPLEFLEWWCHGDVEGRWAWLLDSDPADGVAITSRWELPLAGNGRGLSSAMACWLIQRRLFALTAALAQDLGRALRCPSGSLREWHGSVRQAFRPVDR